MAKKVKKAPFDVNAFLATVDGGRTLCSYRNEEAIFSQGDPADAVFYIQKGQVKLTVVSEQGKDAAHGDSHGNDRMRDHAAGETGYDPRSS